MQNALQEGRGNRDMGSIEASAPEARGAHYLRELEDMKRILRAYGPEEDMAHREALRLAVKILAYLLEEIRALQDAVGVPR
jgi:hypothetical protein